MRPLRCGTRGSALALAQSAWLAARLNAAGIATERVVIQTSGDRFSLGEGAPPAPGPNVKAMFVKEIEEALLAGEIDFAVHSAKDMPGVLPEGLLIAAVPAREDPRDAYLGGAAAPSWSSTGSGSVVATASLRRRIQLQAARPELSFASLRGNVDTRLRRLKAGEFSGLVLARAGLRRLGLGEVPHEALPVSVVVPAPGQGALAVEARADRAEILRALSSVEDPKSRLELDCERSLLAAVGGGCQTPLGALAEVEGTSVRITAFWSDAAGTKPVRLSAEGAAGEAVALGRRLGVELLAAS